MSRPAPPGLRPPLLHDLSVNPIIQRKPHRFYRHTAVHRPPIHKGLHFSNTEIASILVSMISMVLAFYMFNVNDPGIIVGVALGITVHEIVHKLVAQSMGFESRYKLWEIGLVLVIAFAIISRGRFIFAAPGFVVTEGMATVRDIGIISLSAPASNIVLALLFLVIGGPIGTSAAYVNILLAGFNLLPIGPLDGSKVMQWNQSVWSACFIIVLILGLIFIL